MQKRFHFVGTGSTVNHAQQLIDQSTTTTSWVTLFELIPQQLIDKSIITTSWVITPTHKHTHIRTHAHSQIQIKYEEYGK